MLAFIPPWTQETKRPFCKGWILCAHPSPSPHGMLLMQLSLSEHRAQEKDIALSFPKSLLSMNSLSAL